MTETTAAPPLQSERPRDNREMRRQKDRGSPAKWLCQGGLECLFGWGTLGVVGALLAGCGSTTRNQGDGGGADGNGSGSNQGGSATTGGKTAGGGPNGGVGATIALPGTPKFYRFVRLTNSQWAASVQEVLKLAKPSGLEQVFADAVAGITDFSNNEALLDVDSRAWEDFRDAAEVLAEQVTASDEALAAVYPGTDRAGFIEAVGRRAYRRPLTAAEVTKCQALFEAGAAMSGARSPFAKGAALVIRALLQSPHFLFRTELGPSGEALSGYEAAAKLSLWLRGSTPDDVLLDEAEGLTSADALVDVATRMLPEPAVTGVMRDFHGQLLHFERFPQLSKRETPGYTPDLNAELQESSFLFFDRIFEQGLGVRDILTSTRGFYGPGMAPLYGFEPEANGQVERELGPLRVGYFSQLPFLVLNGRNEAPDSFHRGVSLALDVLCSPLGPPVNEIPPLPEPQRLQTNRQRGEAATKACGGICHNEIINPLGFAFEHFDGMGQYRDAEASGLPIDSSGSYTFGTGPVAFADNTELMAAMASAPDVHLCYAKKLASFALQRDIVASDLPWLKELATVSQDAGSTKELMLWLIKNDAFRTRGGGAP